MTTQDTQKIKGPGPLIAVVDDDPSFLRSVARLLRIAGYSVTAFASPRAFLKSLSSSLPQCLVLDIHMPEMTGLELQKRLDAQGVCLPVIFVTAYDTPQSRKQAHRAGGFGFLLKPFDQQALLLAVREALGGQSPEFPGALGESPPQRPWNGDSHHGPNHTGRGR